MILEEIENEERDRSLNSFELLMLSMTNGFQVQLNMFMVKKSNLSIICLILYNCVKFQQCISIYEEDINN